VVVSGPTGAAAGSGLGYVQQVTSSVPSEPGAAPPAADDPRARQPAEPPPAEPSPAEPAGDAAEGPRPEETRVGGFSVRLDNFEGPFDLLLQLISKHKLDVTEVALSKVTDEFIAHIRAMGAEWDLDEASEFLIIAATLLDLKAARLLPTAEVEDEEDLALLEARDLLFARLLQYKAFKEAAAYLSRLAGDSSRRYPRTVGLDPRYAELLPEIVIGLGLDRFAQLAARAMTPKPPPTVATDHIHMVRVSVREHAAILAERLQRLGTATFRHLCADCGSTLEMVARFLALLELYRENLVGFEQVQALGELTVRWTGGDQTADIEVDEYAGTPPPLAAAPQPGADQPGGESGPSPSHPTEETPQ
jgi:segregation and condensation protein A